MGSSGPVHDGSWQDELNLETLLSESQLSIDDMNKPTEFACDLEQTVFNLAKNVEDIKFSVMESQKHRGKMMEMVSSLELPAIPPSLDEGLDELRMSCALSMAIEYIGWKAFDPAKQHAKQALDFAARQGNETSIARCNYWLGRIELEQGNIPSAYKFFMAARPCAMNDKGLEGSTLEYYLKISHPTLGEKHRRRVSPLRSHAKLEGTLTQVDTHHSGNNQSKKRKQFTWTSELVLRPAKLAGHPQAGSVAAKGNRKHNNRPVVWEAENTEDALHANSPLRIIPKDEINADGMEWLTVAKSGPRLSQSKFTFRCYPKGLAPRSRPTEIFPEQPGENIIAAEKWEVLHEHFKIKRVTLAYLSLERWRNFGLDRSFKDNMAKKGVSWRFQETYF
ncbi:uncharacterized protein N7503_006638 [Penicillium pulvis]|uniref:uncharacterized protein n=1 Tax=Penicillium pulvis TaxID=1562058 RepID=UPI0025469F16|nr:uncharacterized protein N7503_006638 [Penicillium pulvis]KAJ5797342.1 hypothetical protein N7503_006638 [Penicillium pulvis]